MQKALTRREKARGQRTPAAEVLRGREGTGEEKGGRYPSEERERETDEA